VGGTNEGSCICLIVVSVDNDLMKLVG
jgi:hypothetical protein